VIGRQRDGKTGEFKDNEKRIMKDHQFRKLIVWQRAMAFVVKIYNLTSFFPKEEKFGLTNQIRRAATSVPLNIAEGSGSGSNMEFCRFLHIAKRSVYEVITGLEIANNLKYLKQEQHEIIKESEEICLMIVGLINKLKK